MAFDATALINTVSITISLSAIMILLVSDKNNLSPELKRVMNMFMAILVTFFLASVMSALQAFGVVALSSTMIASISLITSILFIKASYTISHISFLGIADPETFSNAFIDALKKGGNVK